MQEKEELEMDHCEETEVHEELLRLSLIHISEPTRP
mgnify:CR=1 FL=1